jgi:hypothetical protein
LLIASLFATDDRFLTGTEDQNKIQFFQDVIEDVIWEDDYSVASDLTSDGLSDQGN